MAIDETVLARVICRANLQKKVDGFFVSGDATKAMEPGIRAMLERDVAEKWQAYLPEARAVIAALDENDYRKDI